MTEWSQRAQVYRINSVRSGAFLQPIPEPKQRVKRSRYPKRRIH
jgi:hypothetical protein